MLAAVTAWRDAVADMIPEVPRGIEASKKITDQQVLDWIAADQAKTPAETRELIKYASFHTLHNAGVSALNLNHARVGLSKALNTTARWAPRIVNPVDVNGKGPLCIEHRGCRARARLRSQGRPRQRSPCGL